MKKAELKKIATEAVEKWLNSLDNDEYKGMDEFMLSFQIIRCECGNVHNLKVLRDYGGAVECADDCADDDDYEDPETRGEIQ